MRCRKYVLDTLPKRDIQKVGAGDRTVRILASSPRCRTTVGPSCYSPLADLEKTHSAASLIRGFRWYGRPAVRAI